uniref:MATH domain-containing protein n=1 Tax=Aegilops tauschii subsp. strangulata TaxID=200361 RepID=A0A453PXK4_AEGTS
MLSTGKRSSSVIVGRTESGHHTYTIDGHPTGNHCRSPPFQVGGHNWCVTYFPNGVDAAYADHVSLGILLDEDVKAPVKLKHYFCLAGEAKDEAEQAAWLSFAKLGYYTRENGSTYATFIKAEDMNFGKGIWRTTVFWDSSERIR